MKIGSVLLMVLLAAFYVIGCGSSPNITEFVTNDQQENSTNDSRNLGETLNLSGQVNEFTGNREVKALGITGSITDGYFNIFSIGTPDDDYLEDIEEAFFHILWESAGTNFSDTSARAVCLYLSIGSGASIALATPDFKTSVFHFYVDRDVIISRESMGEVNAYNLHLNKGWNAILRENFNTFTLANRDDLLWSISQDM